MEVVQDHILWEEGLVCREGKDADGEEMLLFFHDCIQDLLSIHMYCICSCKQNCVSVPVLQISSFESFSRFHIYVLIHNICFSLSDLLYSV